MNTDPPSQVSAPSSSGALLAGGVAAILASTCCLGPLVLITVGVSGAWISNLTLLEPYQPIFVGTAVIVQAEVWFRFRLGIREKLGAQDWLVLERLLGAEQADLVVFSDMGKAWLTGDGPGRVPNNRIPQPSEWDYDLGVGLDFDGLAIYFALPTRDLWPPRFTVRLQRRF